MEPSSRLIRLSKRIVSVWERLHGLCRDTAHSEEIDRTEDGRDLPESIICVDWQYIVVCRTVEYF